MSKTASVKNRNRISDIRRSERGTVKVEREIVRGRSLYMDAPARTLRRVGKILSLRNLIAFLLAAIVICAALVIMLFNFEEAVIYGNTKYSQEQIESFITRGRMGENTFVMALKYHHRKVEDIPFIDQIDIGIVNPSTVRVNIKEKPLDACIFFGGKNVYFSADGLIEAVSGRNIEGPTKVNGLVLTHSDIGKQALAKNQYGLDLTLELLRILGKYNMHADTVDVDQKTSLTVTFGDVKILIGKTGFDQKMYRIHQILPQLEGRSGVISMTGFAYEYGGSDIVLSQEKPADEAEETETETDKETEAETEKETETEKDPEKAEEPKEAQTSTSGENPSDGNAEEKDPEKTEEREKAQTSASASEDNPSNENTEEKDPTKTEETEKTQTPASGDKKEQVRPDDSKLSESKTEEKTEEIQTAGAAAEKSDQKKAANKSAAEKADQKKADNKPATEKSDQKKADNKSAAEKADHQTVSGNH